MNLKPIAQSSLLESSSFSFTHNRDATYAIFITDEISQTAAAATTIITTIYHF